jgi:hypothetical protein
MDCRLLEIACPGSGTEALRSRSAERIGHGLPQGAPWAFGEAVIDTAIEA